MNAYDTYSGGEQRRRGRFILAPLILAIIFALFQYFSAETFVNPETGKPARVSISPEQEEMLGLQSFKEVLSQSVILESGPQVDQVRRVVEKLVPQVDQASQQFQWAVSVIDSNQINAFCLPGGKIAVYKGILPVAQNDAGLATVISHEIAHATARHGAQRLFQQGLLQTVMGGVQGSLAEYDPRQRQLIVGLLGAGAQYGMVLPFGRDHELEADEMGLRYMVRAGYDPREAIAFWRRMDQQSAANPPEWASTHPSHGSRIQRISDLIASGTLN